MRVPGWQVALEREFAEANGRRFRWGRNDCCQFVARCTLAITGIDRRALFSRYATRAGAEALLIECGGMRGLLMRAFGDPVHASRAMPGDVVYIELGNGLQPAICTGVNSYAPGRRNLVHAPTLSAVAAWNI